MADFVQGIDVSRWQGVINFPVVKASGVQVVAIKVSGSDAGDYVDAKAGVNYANALNAGFIPVTYHFAGGTDPIHEADFFVNTCSPLDENQVLVLDWEVQHADPVGWVNAFTIHVHDRTGVWPIIYLNGSTRNAYDWSVVAKNCAFWIAWYGRSPETVLPVNGSYIAHQYSSTGAVAGISGNVDLDAWFISLDTLKKYGYHAPVATPDPVPEQPPVPVSDPVPVPDPTPGVPTDVPGSTDTPAPADPTPTPVTPTEPVPTPKPTPVPVAASPWEKVLKAIIAFLEKLLKR